MLFGAGNGPEHFSSLQRGKLLITWLLHTTFQIYSVLLKKLLPSVGLYHDTSALTIYKPSVNAYHKRLDYMKACTVPAGYVHGKSPEICPHGCKPDPNLGQNETPVQTLIREALEFQVTQMLTGWLCGLPY